MRTLLFRLKLWWREFKRKNIVMEYPYAGRM